MATPALTQPQYYVVFMTTIFESLAAVRLDAPTQMASHLARSRQLHADGILLMAGAFLDEPGSPVRTMGVLVSRQAAEDYTHGDPFVVDGMVTEWSVREWANMLR